MAATNLAGDVATLQSQGVSVFTYHLEIQLISPRRTAAGACEFTLTGPPGVYAVLASTNLAAWSKWAAVTNQLGTAVFTDAQANSSPQKFYRLRSPGSRWTATDQLVRKPRGEFSWPFLYCNR